MSNNENSNAFRQPPPTPTHPLEENRPPAQNPNYESTHSSAEPPGSMEIEESDHILAASPTAPLVIIDDGSNQASHASSSVPSVSSNDRIQSTNRAQGTDFIGSASSSDLEMSRTNSRENLQAHSHHHGHGHHSHPAASSSSAPPSNERDVSQGWDTVRGQGLLMLQTRADNSWSNWFFGTGDTLARIILRDPSRIDGRGTVLCTFESENAAIRALNHIDANIRSNLGENATRDDIVNLYDELSKNEKAREILLIGVEGTIPGEGGEQARTQSRGRGGGTRTQVDEPDIDMHDLPDGDDCPICMEPIESAESAMRCNGNGTSTGPRHYFHGHCLKDWIKSCRQQGTIPTCPLCRGALQINRRRMQQFMTSAEAEDWDEEEINFVQTMIKMAGGSEEWQDVFTTENLKTAGAIVGAAGRRFFNNVRFYPVKVHKTNCRTTGWGFYSGWTQRPYTLMDQFAFEAMPQHARVACTAGWAAGFFARLVKELNSDPKDRDRKR